MHFEFQKKLKTTTRLTAFWNESIPNERHYHEHTTAEPLAAGPHHEELKPQARAAASGICSCRRANSAPDSHLSTPLCEIMGRYRWRPSLNCSAPTGNMEYRTHGTPL